VKEPGETTFELFVFYGLLYRKYQSTSSYKNEVRRVELLVILQQPIGESQHLLKISHKYTYWLLRLRWLKRDDEEAKINS
jgi:hypothetical protein